MALELGDIQGNVLPGFYKDVQDFFFVRFSGRREAREWLRRISPYVSYAAEISRANADFLARKQRGNVSPTPQFWVNVALSYQGLQVLGATGLQSFPIEFRASAEDRARRLGDRPTYATWDIGGPQTEPDALVILGANDDAQMQTLYEHFAIDGKTMCGAPILALKRGRTLGGAEHFGFKDGLS